MLLASIKTGLAGRHLRSLSSITTDEVVVFPSVTKSDTAIRVTEKVSSGSVTSSTVIVMAVHCVDPSGDIEGNVSWVSSGTWSAAAGEIGNRH